jgi:hypothetical protein
VRSIPTRSIYSLNFHRKNLRKPPENLRKLPENLRITEIQLFFCSLLTGNIFRSMDSLVLRHPIICKEFNVRSFHSVEECPEATFLEPKGRQQKSVDLYKLFSLRFSPFSRPMRPKSRGLAQHGGPPGWLEKSVMLYKMDRPYRLPFPYRTGCPHSIGSAAS